MKLQHKQNKSPTQQEQKLKMKHQTKILTKHTNRRGRTTNILTNHSQQLETNMQENKRTRHSLTPQGQTKHNKMFKTKGPPKQGGENLLLGRTLIDQ
jgi:hypothetical protein